LWLPGADNNAAITEFVVYYQDWSSDAPRQPPFNRSALTVGARLARRANVRYAMQLTNLNHGLLNSGSIKILYMILKLKFTKPEAKPMSQS